MNKFLNKKFLAGTILVFGFAAATVITQAQTSSGASSISLKKDSGTGFFVMTIKASAGIREFVLYPAGKSSYGGGMSCQTVYKNELVVFSDPDDFTPKMAATITDCAGVSTDFDLFPPQDGLTVGKRVAPAPETPATIPTSESSETKAKPKSTILANVKFPVSELGNCQSETECVSYCNDVVHAKACLEFAKKNNILSADEVEKREKLVNISDGPGGCNSQKSCEDYCSDVSKIDECFSFAEKNNLLSPQELQKIGKIKAAVKSGLKLPGGCNNQKSCEAYCNNAEHMDECLAFGEQSGFLDAQEIQQYRKFSELQKSGETPGKCSSKESCEAYCTIPDNTEECISFAEKAGFLSGEELEQAKKILPLLKEGKTPGGCRTKEQCQSYCEDGNHTDECVEFGLKAGIISTKDAELMKKTGGKGPGGCHSKEQCETYCKENPKECMDWAKENGLEGELSGPEGGGFSGPGGCKNQEECVEYCKGHPQECQNFSPSGGGSFRGDEQGGDESGGTGSESEEHDGLTECGIVAGAEAAYVCGINGKGAPPGKETTYFNECHGKQHGAEILHGGVCKGHVPCSNIADPVCGTDGGNYVAECYAKENGAVVRHKGVCTKEESEEHHGFTMPSSGFNGPGGCRSKDDCTAYCEANPEACQNFVLPGAGIQKGGSGEAGPGGCKTFEDCQRYCKANPDDAKCKGAPPATSAPTDTGTGFQNQGQDSSLACAKSGGSWDGTKCNLPATNQNQYPQSGGTSYEIPTTPELCASFSSTPSCSYVGSPDSQNYQLCKKCYPNK